METGAVGVSAILVGKKPVMNYVLACLTAFQNGSSQVTLKARGRAISKAVDAALLTVERYSPSTTLGPIKIDTEWLRESDSGAPREVSSIEIRLLNPGTASGRYSGRL
jgi:archaea-specific DNA-binding protein